MEIGSFLELSFAKGKEWYAGDRDIARLNSGRAAIWYAAKALGVSRVWLPRYQCDTVREFLLANGMAVQYYNIDRDFTPELPANAADTAVVLCNYYGVMGEARMRTLASRYQNVIIDNCQGFFAKPIVQAMNVYSARKFVGVPDGAYVIGCGAMQNLSAYPLDFSSDTADFLLKRIEYGCEGATYAARMRNEERIDHAPCRQMSRLTHAILDGTDYTPIIEKRRENFELAHTLFADINLLQPKQYYEATTVPMVYPLLVEQEDLLDILLANKHFQGHWWSYLLDEVAPNTTEAWLSRYMIPITIDQRYGAAELNAVYQIVKEHLKS